MTEAEAKNSLNNVTDEFAKLRELYHIIKNAVAEKMHNEIEGDNELQSKLLLAIQLERYFGNLARELSERAETRLLIMGVSKTGAKKRIVGMHEMAKQFTL